MASSEGIESHTNHVLSPLDGEDRNVRGTGIVSTDEGRLSRPDIDLKPNSPSFARERSYTFGTPSGEVQFRRPIMNVKGNQLKILVYILNKIKTTQVEIKTQMTLGHRSRALVYHPISQIGYKQPSIVAL